MDAPPVQYVVTPEGVRIAYTSTGNGPPLVFMPIPPNYTIQVAWGFTRPYRPWLEGLSAHFRVIHYDGRGTGLSTRSVNDLSLDGHLRDLVALVEHLNLQSFLLLAASGYGHVAVRYAVANVQRLAALIIVGCPVSGAVWSKAMWDLLPDEDWKLFLRGLVPPGLTLDENRRYLGALLESSSQESMRDAIRAALKSDIQDILPLVTTPTLVLHSRDQVDLIPEESMRLSALVPRARMVLIDGSDMFGNHEQGLRAVGDFIENLRQTVSASMAEPPPIYEFSARELDVLRLIAAGKTNRQIAADLFISPNTVQNHVASILAKAGLANRAGAAAYAQRHGLA